MEEEAEPLTGYLILTECDTSALLPLFLEKTDAPFHVERNNPWLDLSALQTDLPAVVAYTTYNPRRSSRLHKTNDNGDLKRRREPSPSAMSKAPRLSPSSSACASSSRLPPQTASRLPRPQKPLTVFEEKWLLSDRSLRTPDHIWR